ncbi:ThiF family adenylyltransferase [Flaviaesturariibacter amylovorans]|uniref:THIF-type NAD/FAD binding fold domain-containing protein n=1 Tax=Flaviaesturariibacter amylovorans TaxID=1084520 RepID=A0ABP8H698_9BACT
MMETLHWHKAPAFENLYQAETNLLRGGLGGDFELVELLEPAADGRITATGWLRFGNEGQRQAILIIFPFKYPYRLPSIFPLLDDDNGAIIQQAKFFRKGNQYNNGMMCLMPKEQWTPHQDNIGSLLRRAQRWLVRASSAEGFPKEEIVEEIPSMLAHSGQILMGRSFQVPPNARTGSIIFTQFKPNFYILEENILPINPFPLKINKEVFKWYAFGPGQTFASLFPGDFSIQAVLNLLKANFGEEPQALLAQPNIGFYLPDDPNPWHFFKFTVVNGQGFAGQPNYLITRIVENELYHRTKDIFDDQVLAQKRVTIIGLGAIGSEVARSLARNGVGHFNLFDNDTFEIGNSVRHAADLYYIGESKTAVARQLILRSNPNITVAEFPNLDVLDDAGLLEQCLEASDLCLVLTAEESVDYHINDTFVPRYKYAFVFARVSAGGLSGAVQVVQYGKTACLRCLTKHGADVLPAPTLDRTYSELGPEYGGCSAPAVPGSEVDTKEIALQVSRISLQLLLEDTQSSYAPRMGDQFYWHGPWGTDGRPPFTWEFIKLEKHSDCELCNPRH